MHFLCIIVVKDKHLHLLNFCSVHQVAHIYLLYFGKLEGYVFVSLTVRLSYPLGICSVKSRTSPLAQSILSSER